MDYKRLQIKTENLNKLAAEACEILTLWQENNPDKIIHLENKNGKDVYKIVDRVENNG